MKMTTLQLALCLSLIAHALALPALSLALRSRNLAHPYPSFVNDPVLVIASPPEPEPQSHAERPATSQAQAPIAVPIPVATPAPVVAKTPVVEPQLKKETEKPQEKQHQEPAKPVEKKQVIPDMPPIALPVAVSSPPEKGEAEFFASETATEPVNLPAVPTADAKMAEAKVPSTAQTGPALNSGPIHTTGESGGSPAGYRYNPKPAYPRESRKLKQEGCVLLDVTVAASGQPTRVVVKKSSGHALLDETAVRSVKNWRFRPAKKQNLPVASQVDVPIEFKLLDR